MKNKSRENKGQFSIIAALLVSVILVASVIMIYSSIRYSPITETPKTLTSISETNLAISRVLEFTLGYYGSILQVTGNTSYARSSASSYLRSGLVNIARSYPEWNPSFNLDFQQFSTCWFMPESYSRGNISVTYSLSGLGIQGIKYETSSLLKVTMLEHANAFEAKFQVTRENNEPELRLTRENFFFYNYSYQDSTWKLINPESDPITYYDGTYVLKIPSGVDISAYSLKVADQRGINTIAFYSEASLASGIPQYAYTFDWNATGKEHIYSSLSRDTIVTEVLQNGTLRWLGQNLQTSELAGPRVLYGRPSSDNGWNTNPENIHDQDTATYGTYIAATGGAYVGAFNTSTGTINQVDVRIRWEWLGDLGSDTVEWAWNIGGSGGGTLYGPSDVSHSLTTDSYNSIGSNWTWSKIQDLRIQLNYVKDQSSGPDVNVYEVWILVQAKDTDTYESSPGKPILPIPVKALHVNQTIDGVNYETPFQVEDWTSNYRTPLGLTSNVSIFNSRNLLAFLVNHEVENVILWWDGMDTANQTSYAWKNNYFLSDDTSDPSYVFLSNGILDMTIDARGSAFTVTSTQENSSSTAEFMRINGEQPVYGSDPATVIHHGIVRDIVQAEAEWSTGIPNCPNLYSQIVLTLPAKATYYTYALRTVFVNSSQSRTITDLSAIQISVSVGQQSTENGTSGGYPISSNATGLFYNFSSSTGYAHHWSEFISGNSGAGILFTDDANQRLYVFDKFAGNKTGAIKVISSGRIIEVNPVERYAASFTSPLDVTWHGTVTTFADDPIYPSSGDVGLWVIAEHPPSVVVS
ncbi:MAG: hypothetical protein JSV75_01985 [Candidatus Bathyarchaeota archaeon]|nr:MAG: hypothetical protein JSV75_01985 [Candidatus Bathyarchaeota archaeon]